MHCGVVTFAT
jgi:hypothetical protein